MSEHTEQVALFHWVALHEGEWPELKLLYAIPNGGLRNIAVAMKLKAEGVKPGVPDVHLPVGRGGYIGCWIEMKHGDNKPTREQREWIAALRQAGHFVTVCYSWEDAAEILERYLAGEIVRGEAEQIGASG